MKYYKALTPERLSFYDGKTAWKLGEAMPVIGGHKNGPCGPGYHLAKSVKDAVGYAKFPMALFEAEPVGEILGEDATKARYSSARIVREIRKPVWVKRAESFIASITSVKWLDGHAKPRQSWKMFDTWDAARDAAGAAARDAAGAAAWDAAGAAARDAAGAAARDAAGAAARDAAGAAAWDAARDAALQARMEIICDLQIPAKHRKHAKARWDVWERGYGLLCDVDGELYCYRKIV